MQNMCPIHSLCARRVCLAEAVPTSVSGLCMGTKAGSPDLKRDLASSTARYLQHSDKGSVWCCGAGSSIKLLSGGCPEAGGPDDAGNLADGHSVELLHASWAHCTGLAR